MEFSDRYIQFISFVNLPKSQENISLIDHQFHVDKNHPLHTNHGHVYLLDINALSIDDTAP